MSCVDFGALAQDVAKRLRKRIFAVAVCYHVLVARICGENPNYRSKLAYYTMTSSDFDNLTAKGIAANILENEAKLSKELVGDK